VHGDHPLEIRVLATLTSGPLSAAEIALRTGGPESVVAPILERCLAEQAVTRINLARAPAYSLTPKGLHAVGVYQGVQDAQGAVGSVDHVHLEPATRLVMEQYDAARDLAASDAVSTSLPVGQVEEHQAPRKVNWRHVLYAAAYLLVGALFLLFLQAAVGVAMILTGLALGLWTLRPLLASSTTRPSAS
jgi:hypothetical protein